jgi:hypothetical protein
MSTLLCDETTADILVTIPRFRGRQARRLNSLACELSWIRAAGFTLSDRLERFSRLLCDLASETRSDPSELWDQVTRLADHIDADSRQSANADLARKARVAS